MKQFNFLLGALALSACIGAATAVAQKDEGTDFSEVSREAKDLLNALGEYGAGQRDEAMAATRSALEEVDRSIHELEDTMHDKWDSMDAAARERARESMRALRRERTELAEWYGAMKNNSGDAWEDVKQGFSEAYEALGEAWRSAKKEFGDT